MTGSLARRSPRRASAPPSMCGSSAKEFSLVLAKAPEKAFVFKRLENARIHERCRICFQRGGLRPSNLRNQCFHAIQRGVRRVGKRSLQISVRVIERGEIGLRVFLQNSDGVSFLAFKEMDPFNCGASETQHRVVLLPEHALACDDTAMRVWNAFAGAVGQSLKF